MFHSCQYLFFLVILLYTQLYIILHMYMHIFLSSKFSCISGPITPLIIGFGLSLQHQVEREVLDIQDIINMTVINTHEYKGSFS